VRTLLAVGCLIVIVILSAILALVILRLFGLWPTSMIELELIVKSLI